MQRRTDKYVLDLRSPRWQQSKRGDLLYWDSLGDDAPVPLGELREGRSEEIPANWAAVLVGDTSISLYADVARSHALFYARTYQDGGQQWVITDSPEAMRQYLPDWRRDELASQVFRFVGFTLNARTLVAGVSVVEAASLVRLPLAGDGAEISFWGVPVYDETGCLDAREFSDRYARALDTAVGDLLRRSENRQLVLPLSGGLDSRLLASWLRKLGAPNVVAFTYGKPGSAEVAVSRSVAEELNIPFTAVELDVKEVRKEWFSRGTDGFRAATWNATALPHIQDWYALTVLRRRRLIDDNAVFLPGHTPVGMMHNRELTTLADGAPVEGRIAAALADHHSVDRRHRNSLLRDPEFRRALSRTFRQIPEGGRSVQNAVEWFNYRERQAKYINNSMAAYEYFGWSWALPLYWPPALGAWLTGSEELTADRRWYRDFVDDAFQRQTGGANAVYFAPPAESSRIPFRETLLSVARRSGLNRALSRLWELRVETNHPLGLEAFSTAPSTGALILELAGGRKLMGTWARDFLENQWGSPEQSLVPRRGAAPPEGAKPRLLLISYSNIAHDARLLKQIDLFSESYEVTVVGHGLPFRTNAELVLFGEAESRSSARRRALLLHGKKYALAHRLEANNLRARELLRGRSFDAVIANDIEPVGLAIELYGRNKVHADLHEYYPGLQDEDPAWVKLRQPYYQWMLKHHAARAASATTVSDAIARRYLDEFGFECGVVENARPFERMLPSRVEEPIRLVHAGAGTTSRNLEMLMRATARAARPVTLDLFLTGEGTQYYRSLIALSDTLGERVHVHKPVDPDVLVPTLNHFDVGLHVLPPRPTNNYLALPNKLFDYVQARLGVIVGPTPAMADLVKKFDIGAVMRDFDEDSLVELINELTPEQVQDWKTNSNRAATDLDATSVLRVWSEAVGEIVGTR